MIAKFIALLCFIGLTVAVYNERVKPPVDDLQDKCAYCTAMTQLTQWAKTNQLGSDYVNEQLMHMCSLSHQSYSCLKHSHKFMPFIVDAIEQRPDEGPKICKTILNSDCTKFAKLNKINGFECSVCQMWIKLMVRRLSSMEDSVKLLFEKICESRIMTDSGQQLCKEVFQDNFKEAFEAVLQTLLKNSICTLSHMCSVVPDNAQTAADLETTIIKNATCNLCETFFGFIESGLERAEFEKVFLATVEKTCLFMPTAKIQEKCLKFAHEEAVKFVEDVLKFLTPEIFCPALRFC